MTGERRNEIDALRIFGTAFVFLFHSIQPFNPGDHWHIQNNEKSAALGVIVTLLNIWIMPLFMFLAGSGAYFSLQKRSSLRFLKDRVLRIFVPLIFGILFLVPPQVYFERLEKVQITGSYLDFYPHFFDGVYPSGNFSYHHLWFLVYLLIYSLIGIVFFQALKTKRGRQFLEYLANNFSSWIGLYVFALPLMLARGLLGRSFPQTNALLNDWTWHSELFLSFFLGYVLMSDSRYGQTLTKRWVENIVVALLLTMAVFALRQIQVANDSPAIKWLFPIKACVYRLTTWSWILALLGAASRLSKGKAWKLQNLSEANLPVYVLHQTLIVSVAYYVVIAGFGIMTKFAIVFSLSAALTAGVYLFARRIGPLRFFLGMQPMKAAKR